MKVGVDIGPMKLNIILPTDY